MSSLDAPLTRAPWTIAFALGAINTFDFQKSFLALKFARWRIALGRLSSSEASVKTDSRHLWEKNVRKWLRIAVISACWSWGLSKVLILLAISAKFYSPKFANCWGYNDLFREECWILIQLDDDTFCVWTNIRPTGSLSDDRVQS